MLPGGVVHEEEDQLVVLGTFEIAVTCLGSLFKLRFGDLSNIETWLGLVEKLVWGVCLN